MEDFSLRVLIIHEKFDLVHFDRKNREKTAINTFTF